MNTVGLFKTRIKKGMKRNPVNQGDVIKIKRVFRALNVPSQVEISGDCMIVSVDGLKYRVIKYQVPDMYIVNEYHRLRNNKFPGKVFEIKAGSILKSTIRGKFNTPGYLIDHNNQSIFFPYFCFLKEVEFDIEDAFSPLFRYRFNKITIN